MESTETKNGFPTQKTYIVQRCISAGLPPPPPPPPGCKYMASGGGEGGLTVKPKYTERPRAEGWKGVVLNFNCNTLACGHLYIYTNIYTIPNCFYVTLLLVLSLGPLKHCCRK